jgi:hypothetical protein
MLAGLGTMDTSNRSLGAILRQSRDDSQGIPPAGKPSSFLRFLVVSIGFFDGELRCIDENRFDEDKFEERRFQKHNSCLHVRLRPGSDIFRSPESAGTSRPTDRRAHTRRLRYPPDERVRANVFTTELPQAGKRGSVRAIQALDAILCSDRCSGFECSGGIENATAT